MSNTGVQEPTATRLGMEALIHALHPLDRAGASTGMWDALRCIQEEHYPIQIESVPSGTEISGWRMLPSWEVIEAYFSDGKTRFADYARCPLHLYSYSPPHQATLTKADLQAHVTTDAERPSNVPYHFRNQFQFHPHNQRWGFCLSKNEWDEVPDDTPLQVVIRTREPGRDFPIGTFYLPGSSSQTILLAAHLCHPSQVADALTGVALQLALLDWLNTAGTPRYSYQLVLGQEYLAPLAFKHLHPERVKATIAALILDSAGNHAPLTIQTSYSGDGPLDQVFDHLVRFGNYKASVRAFREVLGNDEYIYNGPGFGIPSTAVIRFPYPEYHSDKDNLDAYDGATLESDLDFLKQGLRILEEDCLISLEVDAIPCLNRHGLYVPPELDAEAIRRVSDGLFYTLTKPWSMFALARRLEVNFFVLQSLVRRYEEAGLVSTRPLEDS